MIRMIFVIVASTIIGALLAPAVCGENVTLSWTAPGDDGFVGTAASYELRFAPYRITTSNWSQATVVSGLPAPLPAGSQQSFTVNNVDPNQSYFFAIRARDEAGNWSDVSNNAIWSHCLCVNLRGNADGDPYDQVTINDLREIIAVVFRGQAGVPCPAEANVDGSPDGIIDIVDVNLLIGYLYRDPSQYHPAPCQ